MGTFGARLQREREMRGISLDEIAEATKIGTRSLQALEKEEFDKLPGGIFNKGFVRAYAKFLGISEEQAVSDYMTAVGEAQDEAEENDADTLKAMAAAREAAAKAAAAQSGQGASGSLVAVAAAVLLFGGAVFGGWEFLRNRPADTPPPPPVSASAVPSISVPPVTASKAIKVAAPVEKPAVVKVAKAAGETKPATANEAETFELLIRAREASWMSITADGKEVMSGTLGASNERSVRAHDRVVLRIGNAGGVEISQNGKLVGPLGESGKPRTITVTANGVQQ